MSHFRCTITFYSPQDFYDLMSNEGQAVMRRLDVVTVKGSEVPIGIYTYDALQDQYFREDRYMFLLLHFCVSVFF